MTLLQYLRQLSGSWLSGEPMETPTPRDLRQEPAQ